MKADVYIILTRILGFVPFAVLAAVGCLVLWIKHMVNFTLYGGESIAYTKKTQRKCIFDVFVKLQEQMEGEK